MKARSREAKRPSILDKGPANQTLVGTSEEPLGNVRTVNRAAVGGCIDRLFLISEGTCGLVVGNHTDRSGGG